MKIDSEKLIKQLEQEKQCMERFLAVFGVGRTGSNIRSAIKAIDKAIAIAQEMEKDAEARSQILGDVAIKAGIYDEMEIHHNCTVQILHNTITDEYSFGWWNNEGKPDE